MGIEVQVYCAINQCRKLIVKVVGPYTKVSSEQFLCEVDSLDVLFGRIKHLASFSNIFWF